MTFVYLHGFNSDGQGQKYQWMKEAFPDHTVLSPDLPANPAAVVRVLDELHQNAEGPVFLLGTSLGGFYSYYYHIKSGFPVFLFNPVMQPHIQLADRVGMHHTFTKQRPYDFKASFLDTFEQLSQEAGTQQRPELLHFFLATDDEVLDLSGIPSQFPEAAFLAHYDKSLHTFSRFAEVLPKVKDFAYSFEREH